MDKKSINSAVLKCKTTTFFFDVNLASNQKRYLKVTESRMVNGQPSRSSVVVFPEDVSNFLKKITEAAQYLNEAKID